MPYNSTKICGKIKMIGDKSIAHRAVIISSHVKGIHILNNFPKNEDTMTTLNIFEGYGLKYQFKNNDLIINSRDIIFTKKTINCVESGTTARLLSGYLAGLNVDVKIIGKKTLLNRPMSRVVKPLSSFGANIKSTNGNCPIKIKESSLLKACNFNLTVASAQVKSAIILYALSVDGISKIQEKIKTRNHLEILLSYLDYPIDITNNEIKVKGRQVISKRLDIDIPGDVSNASFIIAAAILLKGSLITIKDLGINEFRIGFIKKLVEMGANISFHNNRNIYGEPVADIKVKYSANLKGVIINRMEVPSLIDEIPIFCIVASYAISESIIKGVSELKVKESNRIKAIIENIKSMGGDIRLSDDNLLIKPQKRLYSTSIKSYGDHRIFMAFYIANLVSGSPICDQGIDLCYQKSFTNFLEVIQKVIK